MKMKELSEQPDETPMVLFQSDDGGRPIECTIGWRDRLVDASDHGRVVWLHG